MATRAAALLAAAVTLLAACGGDDDDEAEPAGSSIETVEIAETEFALEPADVTLDRAGVYTFHVVNRGSATHALEVEGENVEMETEELGPGDSADLAVELAEGEYELYCPVGDHADRGMTGSLTVGAATSDEDSGSPY